MQDEEESIKSRRQSDHDLLIELNTRFSLLHTFMKDTDRNIERILMKVDTKVDKEDFNNLAKDLKSISERTTALESARTESQTRRSAFAEMRELGFKGWTFLIAAIGLFITIIKAITK